MNSLNHEYLLFYEQPKCQRPYSIGNPFNICIIRLDKVIMISTFITLDQPESLIYKISPIKCLTFISVGIFLAQPPGSISGADLDLVDIIWGIICNVRASVDGRNGGSVTRRQATG